MNNTVVLRDYQEQGVADIRDAFRGGARRVVYVSPTGSGKTVLFAFVARNAANRGNRVCILEHRRELVRQAGKALDDEGLPFGTIAAGRRDVSRSQVNVAAVQTLARRVEHYRDAFDLIIADEAHHCVAGTWRTVVEANPKARVLGVTATPERLDGVGLGDVFDSMVLGPTVRDLIDRGYLADYRLFRDPNPPDFSKIRRVAGEYHAGDLAEFMSSSTLVGNAVEHYKREADGLPAVVFTVNVDSASMMASSFRDAGYRAASVDGSMDTATRDERIGALGKGLDILTSCELISEGLDVPGISAAILYRPTMSLAMCRQQIGRALRPKIGGGKAIILDHAGNTHKHGLPCTEIEWSLTSKKRKSSVGNSEPVRTCPECFAVQPIGASVCENCGFEFPRKEGPEIVDGSLEEVDVAAFANVSKTRASIDEAIGQCRTWEELEMLRKALGFKRGWAHHAARAIGWQETTNRAGYTVRFDPIAAVAAA